MFTRRINTDLLLKLKQQRNSDIINTLLQTSLSSNKDFILIPESISFEIARKHMDFFDHSYENALNNMPIVESVIELEGQQLPPSQTVKHYSETELEKLQPSIAAQIKSLTTSTVNWVASGMPFASSELLSARTETCKSCDQWDSSAFGGTGRCNICGCSTSLKLRMTTEKCPVGKW
jgi:hypothetical protein